MIACNRSLAPTTAAAMVNAQGLECAHVTTAGEALIVPLTTSALELPPSALAMASACPMGNASASLVTPALLAMRAPLDAPAIAQVVAIAAPVHSACVAQASPASIATSNCLGSRQKR